MDESPEYPSSRHTNKRPRVLVACQRCKSRRQKCDNGSPECSNCSRAKAACSYSDNAYPSSYVKRMEERIRQLEGRASNNVQPHRSHHHAQRSILDDHHRSAPVEPAIPSPQRQLGEPTVERPSHAEPLASGLGLLSSCTVAEPHYFGFSAGLSLAHFVQVAIDSGNNSADVSLPLLADRPFSNRALNANTALATIPSFKTGARYIRAYLSLIHPLYPFLDRSSLWQLHGSLTEQRENFLASHPHVDVALMHLVYATGSRCLQLLGKIDKKDSAPEGHFLSAMKIINDDLKFTSIRSIELTLLLGIHSMRSPSGTSVWHLSGLAIRQCLELGLHKQRRVSGQNIRRDQHRKRLFWSAYIFERKTALVLGRPFALSDDEIVLDLPMSVDDDESEESNLIAALETDQSLLQLERTTLSFHRFHVQLYQLHTEIRLALHQLQRNPTKEQVQLKMTTLFSKLENWRIQFLEVFDSPSKDKPTGSRSRGATRAQELASSESESSVDQEVYQRPAEIEKAELLLEYHKARRSLLQPLMTEGHEVFSFDTADYMACADASGQICQLYRRLHRLSPIPFSLRDLHAVFVAGFTLIYCVCTCPSIYSAERASDVGACSTVLYVITEQWSSAKKYRDAFEVVAEKMMESARRYQEDLHASREIATLRASPYIESNELSGSNVHSNGRSGRREGDDLMNESRSRSPPYAPTTVPVAGYLTSYQDTAHTGPVSNSGMELELDFNFADINGLLSDEGLEWFAGAISHDYRSDFQHI